MSERDQQPPHPSTELGSVPEQGTFHVPSVGIALMAMRLAEVRAGPYWDGFFTEQHCALGTRKAVDDNPDASPVSGEYYRIIDRIARGERP